MPKPLEKCLLILIDFVTINLAFFALVYSRSFLGFDVSFFLQASIGFKIKLSLLVYLYWLLVFLFYGLYRSWYTKSRFDELVTVFKTISFGIFIIFVITIDTNRDFSTPPRVSRLVVLNYWLLMLTMVGIGRLIVHTFERRLLTLGVGVRNTIIVGWSKEAWNLYDKICLFPALGHRVIGFIDAEPAKEPANYKNIPFLGVIKQLGQIIQRERVEEVIIALGSKARKKVMDVIAQCEDLTVSLKIVPDLYDIVMGQARTNQIYGFPLIEIQPQLMKTWEKRIKRLLDIIVAMVVLVLFLPFWLVIGIMIKIDSPGPILFKQKRVGKDGKIFTIFKFRTMVANAEKLTGPVWAGQKDPRITRTGFIMRKMRIDEIPQFFNVLEGDMSLVGPRPERQYFVDRLKRRFPLYMRRLKVKPGITGWAQIKGDYDTTIENVKKKLEYDLFYIENMSLRMDLKILLNTALVMIKGKGQ